METKRVFRGSIVFVAFVFWNTGLQYCWWKKSCTTCYPWNPMKMGYSPYSYQLVRYQGSRRPLSKEVRFEPPFFPVWRGGYLEDHPRYRKWLGSPPFIAPWSERPFGRDLITRSLGSHENDLTMVISHLLVRPSWDDPHFRRHKTKAEFKTSPSSVEPQISVELPLSWTVGIDKWQALGV